MAVPAPSAAEFKSAFPQFDKAPDAFVTKWLGYAAARTTASFYADSEVEKQAVFLRAAVIMGKMPEARKMQLMGDDQAIVWQMELYDLQRSAGMGLRVF